MKNIFIVLTILLLLSSGASVGAAPVNINTATAQELADKLDGIGIKKAQAIIQYREKVGDFHAAEQLLNVKGIGAATLEKNQASILLE